MTQKLLRAVNAGHMWTDRKGEAARGTVASLQPPYAGSSVQFGFEQSALA